MSGGPVMFIPTYGGSATSASTAPTAPAGTNTTQIATTAFVYGTISGIRVDTYGAVADNSGNQATAINTADAAALAAGKPLYFPYGTYRCTAALTCTTDWICEPGTVFSFPTDLGAGVRAIEVATLKSIRNLTLNGSNQNPGLGVAPNAMGGIRLAAKGKLIDCAIHGIKYGVIINGDHVWLERVGIGAGCYFGLYFPASMPTSGDGTFFGVDATGCVMSAIGVASGGKCDGHLFLNSHFGFSPYGTYKEGGSNESIISGCDFISSPFEAIGNAAVYDTGSNNFCFGNRFPEASWDATYNIAANPARALYDGSVWLRNLFDFGDISGLPSFAAGSVSVLYCTNYAQDNMVWPGEQLMVYLGANGGKPLWGGAGDMGRTNTIANRFDASDWFGRIWYAGGTIANGDVVHMVGNNANKADGTKPVIGVAREGRNGGAWIVIQERGRASVKVNAAVVAEASLTPDSGSAGRVKTVNLFTDPFVGTAIAAQATPGGDVEITLAPSSRSATGTALSLPAGTTAMSSLRIASGVAPTSPVSGDFFYDGTNLKFRDGSTTRTITWT